MMAQRQNIVSTVIKNDIASWLLVLTRVEFFKYIYVKNFDATPVL